MAKNYMDKPSRKGKMTNIPVSERSFGTTGKKGQVYKNDLLDTDFTRQDMGTVRKLRSK